MSSQDTTTQTFTFTDGTLTLPDGKMWKVTAITIELTRDKKIEYLGLPVNKIPGRSATITLPGAKPLSGWEGKVNG